MFIYCDSINDNNYCMFVHGPGRYFPMPSQVTSQVILRNCNVVIKVIIDINTTIFTKLNKIMKLMSTKLSMQ